MKRPTLWPILALAAMLTFSCSTDAIEEETIDAIVASHVPNTKEIEIEIMEIINNHRIEAGLNPLNNLGQVKAEAYNHTEYMIERNGISHDNFFIRKANLENTVGAVRVGENVAYGYRYAQSVVNAWLNSPGHRDVIEGDYTDFEISAEQDVEGRWYYTNIFVKK
ncbi:MAG: CAP domain-containing protein [Bacteroidia bacterium]|nr:CAP domain-containing protein [Bacteroidia bacterium]NNF82458.1 CAP domain-containing protein [Flavobacteriaceae bacterium]NNK70686.1 CAP domain-containing protein [Flavobacteriaceae bacterium]NNL80274.1 CAP domain-containing protein [Flavobacteriaceae bacterium]